VSAAAIGTHGQITLLNHPPEAAGNENGGPCYRCIFPKPPPPDSVKSCGEAGILGPVVGVMGVMAALETIRVIIQGPRDQNTQDGTPNKYGGTMKIFDGWIGVTGGMWRDVKLRKRRKDCAACGVSATAKELERDYEAFCGITAQGNVLHDNERIGVTEFSQRKKGGVVVDVRPETEFELGSLENSFNWPIDELERLARRSARADKDQKNQKLDTLGQVFENAEVDAPLYLLCKNGNDSQIAVQRFKELGIAKGRWIGDVRGGLSAWRKEVDDEFPSY
jgi:adenylyltransferase and sulfurtransferase